MGGVDASGGTTILAVISTSISKSRTQLYVTDSIVDAYQKKAPSVDITANIVVPPEASTPPTPNVNVPEVKDFTELASYLDKSVNDAKEAASQAASAASEMIKQSPPVDDGKVHNMFEY